VLALIALVVFVIAMFVPAIGPFPLLLVGLALLAAHLAHPIAIRRSA
jgi:hypothetical protein